MPCSHTPSVETLTHGQSATFCRRYQLSASLAEKIMLMEEFISMYSLTSALDSAQKTHDDLMWTAITRTFNLAVGHQGRCMTMLSKMAMSSQGDSTDQVETMWLGFVHSGIELWMHRMLRNFGTWSEHWLQECSSPTSTVCGATASGAIDPQWLSTSPHPALCSTYQEWRSSANSYARVCLETGLVSYLTPPLGRSGGDPQRLRLGSPYPPYPPALERLNRNSNSVVGRPKSLIIHGETRLGKTLWARSLGEHIYCCLQFNVDDVRAKLEVAKYAVFDDMQGGFKYFPSYKGWLGAQKSFTVTDKYKGKTTIEWGRPTIWVMNESPSSCTDVDYDWLMGNCFIVHVGHAIFRANTE